MEDLGDHLDPASATSTTSGESEGGSGGEPRLEVGTLLERERLEKAAVAPARAMSGMMSERGWSETVTGT